MNALQTDLYQLTMAAGYFASGKVGETAVFELFVRRLPSNREFLIAAGLQQAVEYLLNLQFTAEEIDYLRTLPQFQRAAPDFWDYLRAFRFTGDLFAMPEGTPFFAGEPIAILRAPIIEAQIPETYLLSTIGYQSMIAAKATRVVAAAAGRIVVEFGTRRAHGPEAGVLAGRAAYIGGCTGTSNVEAGHKFAIPVFGTSAHSWVLAFRDEAEAFQRLQQLLGSGTVYLIDTYDTLEGARKAAALGRPIWGVRLDSGDLGALARDVRTVLDSAGLHEAKIMATSDLNEDKIADLVKAGAPIDVFGVGTELATSADAPSVSAVYKMVQLDARYVAKYSPDKRTYPASKQVFRYPKYDIVGYSAECAPEDGLATALLQPVIAGGKLLEPLPSTADIQKHCREALTRISPGHSVDHSRALTDLAERHRRDSRR